MFEILLKGAIGAVAGLLASLGARAIGSRGGSRSKFNLVAFVAIMAIAYQVINATIAPPIRAWKTGRDVDGYLHSDSTCSAIIADNPTIEGPLKARILAGTQGGNVEDVAGAVREIIGEVLPRYMSRAPDDAIVEYTDVIVRVFRNVEARDPDGCYRLLFPNTMPRRSAATGEQEQAVLLRAMRKLILAARERPMAAPKETEVDSTLARVVGRLIARHGEDAYVLQRLSEPGVDRKKVCDVTLDMYAEVLVEPREKAGPVLRYLLSQTKASP